MDPCRTTPHQHGIEGDLTPAQQPAPGIDLAGGAVPVWVGPRLRVAHVGMVEIGDLVRDGIERHNAQSRQLSPGVVQIADAGLRRLAPGSEATGAQPHKLTHRTSSIWKWGVRGAVFRRPLAY